MGNDPPTPRRGALSNDEVRFGMLLAVVAAGLIAVLLIRRRPELDVGRPLRSIEHKVDDRQRRHQAQRLRAACKRKDCDCVAAASEAGLDVDAGRDVLDLLTVAKDCQFPALGGVRAEASARAGSTAEGLRQAADVLAKNPRDAHARTAQGLVAYQSGAWPSAIQSLEDATSLGAGDGALALLGLARYYKNDLVGARTAFQALLAHEPDDLEAEYNLALVAQKQNRYGEARKLYLAVLRARPEQRQARYNMAILAHSIGAEPEAQHHAALLEKTAPGDPMLARLSAALAEPPARRGQVLTLGGPAPSAAP